MLRRNILKTLALGFAGLFTSSAQSAEKTVEIPEPLGKTPCFPTNQEIDDLVGKSVILGEPMTISKACRFTLEGDLRGPHGKVPCFPTEFVQNIDIDYGKKCINFTVVDVAGPSSVLHLISYLENNIHYNNVDSLCLKNYDAKGDVIGSQTFNFLKDFTAATSYGYGFGIDQESTFSIALTYGKLTVT